MFVLLAIPQGSRCLLGHEVCGEEFQFIVRILIDGHELRPALDSAPASVRVNPFDENLE